MYFSKLDSEVVESELRQRDAVTEVFQIKDFILQSEKLLIAIVEIFIDQIFDLIVLKNVVFERGGNVHESHARFNSVLEIDVFVEILSGPEINELDRFGSRCRFGQCVRTAG